MAKKVLSIEVGENVTRVVEMDYMAKSPKIYNAFCFETPQDTVNDEGVKVNEDVIALMKQGLRQKGIRTNSVVFTISSTRIASRDVTIPLVPEKKIKQMLLANSRDYFPVDMTQYELVYRVAETLKEEKQLKLAVLAVPRSLLVSYQQLAKVWGVTIVGMDYNGNSIFQAVTRMMNPVLTATIHVDDTSSVLTIVKDGKLEFQRVVGYGIEGAVQAVRASSGKVEPISYMEAMERMRSKNCFNQQLKGDVDSDDWGDMEDDSTMDARGDATGAVSMLINNLARVLDYYTSRNENVDIERVILTGPGAECKGFDRLLANEFGIPVSPLKDTRAVTLNRNLLRGKFKLSEYMIVVGATFGPLNFTMEAEGGKRSAGAGGGGGNDSMLIPVIVFVVCAVFSGIVVGLPMAANIALEATNADMRSQINAKKPVVEIYNNYLVAAKTYQNVKKADLDTDVPNDVFLEFLADMEKKMPSDLVVDQLSVDGATISLTARCLTRESAAEALMQFRTFETLFQVSCSAVAENESEEGLVEEEFSVTLTYYVEPVNWDEELALSEDGTEAEAEGEAGAESEAGTEAGSEASASTEEAAQ